MVTLQSWLRLQAVVAGPLVGGMIARNMGCGWVLMTISAMGGLAAAILIVEMPYRVLAYVARRRLQRATTAELYESLATHSRHFGRLSILRELCERGADIRRDLPALVSLLSSPAAIERCAGYAALREFFPDVHGQLGDYQPYSPSSPLHPSLGALNYLTTPATGQGRAS